MAEPHRSPSLPLDDAAKHPLTVLLVLSLVVSCVISAGAYFAGHTFLSEGPNLQVYRTAQDIIQTGTIVSPRYKELYDMLLAKSAAEHTHYWQDVFAVSAHGALVPKHCLLLSVLALPFCWAFGQFGAWIFNLGLVALAVAAVWQVVRLVCPISPMSKVAPFFALLALGTELFAYVYGFYYDLLGAVLVLGAFALTIDLPFFAGLSIGLSSFVRISNLAYLPFLFLFAWQVGSQPRGLIRTLAGVLLGVAIFAAFNAYMWGGPFVSVYHRKPGFTDGVMVFDNDSIQFSLAQLSTDWPSKLFDLQSGLLIWNLALILMPWAVWRVRKLEKFPALVTLGLALLSQVLIIFSYEGWRASHAGSRYLLSAALLGLVPIAVLCCKSELRQKRQLN